jgi:hypothetical protein
MNPSSPPALSFSRLQRVGIGLNVLAAIFCVVALVVMVNYLAARHYYRWHLASRENYRLSPQTTHVLQSLTNQVNVIIFFDREEVLFGPVTALLREYAHTSPRVVVRHVDYTRNPSHANLIREKYALMFPAVKDQVFFKNLVLFECNGRIQACYERQMSDYDLSGIVSQKSREVRRSAFLGESLFTSAIISVTEGAPRKAAFLTGHREFSIQNEEDGVGYSQFASVLRQNNILVGGLSLKGTNEVPSDCQLLVIAGARDRFLTAELDRIDRYLQQGGRLLALLYPLGQTGLETLLGRWGVEVGDDLLFDPQNTMNQYDLITSNFFSHPIVRPLARAELHIVNPPRSVAPRASSRQSADAAKVEELVATGPEGMAVTEIRNGVPYRTSQDRRGSLPFMVAVEKGGLQGVSADRGSTRIVVAGEAQFLANQAIYSKANMDFAVQAVNWLLDRPHLMGGINARPVKEYQLIMSRSQVWALRWSLLVVLPGGVLVLGLLVWLRRRR